MVVLQPKETSMKLLSVKRMSLAAAVFTFGAFGSVEWLNNDGPSAGFMRGDFPVTTSAAKAGEVNRATRRASCTLVRHYVDKYGAPAAEAWARSKGATDADIQTTLRCIAPQQTAQVGHAVDRAF
jgi:hypothetical protein